MSTTISFPTHTTFPNIGSYLSKHHPVSTHLYYLRFYGQTSFGNGEFVSTDTFINDQLTFTDKESYLRWRAEWKLEYKRLTMESRKFKKLRSLSGAILVDKTNPWSIRFNAVNMVAKLRDVSYFMLEIRRAGKVRSNELRQKHMLSNVEQ